MLWLAVLPTKAAHFAECQESEWQLGTVDWVTETATSYWCFRMFILLPQADKYLTPGKCHSVKTAECVVNYYKTKCTINVFVPKDKIVSNLLGYKANGVIMSKYWEYTQETWKEGCLLNNLPKLTMLQNYCYLISASKKISSWKMCLRGVLLQHIIPFIQIELRQVCLKCHVWCRITILLTELNNYLSFKICK